ncbi:E3 ubiquitin-protein ligase CBL [Bagarius yarrelli]|uniref:E3 ubiquitin-protein ligase CBL n=1 Tax=Bagarius yarrelli TaxID=175774 RepID=A0A556TQB0_BAGYA|nr:E3 ubiquitin-protein ligase CBL [Bagarius yarrelli]
MAGSLMGIVRSFETDLSSSESQPLTSTDHRLLEKVLKRLQKLHKLCTDPRLCLKNSPPYLPELVRETVTLITEIWTPYRGSVSAVPRGDEGEYLRIHVQHLLDKTDRAILLFKEGKEKMFEEKSNYRRNLTKLSLLFSHMLWELRAIFPAGQFQGDTFTLTKTEAREFWRKMFGQKCIVKWSIFKQHLKNVHHFEEGMEAMALKSTIDLTCNDYVSIFEFDIFTRLFQPWSTLLRNWNHLAVTHPGYMAFLTYDQVQARLEHHKHRPGSYIFRLSCTRMGQWAIGYVTPVYSIVQTIPENTPLYQALIQGFRQGCYLYPDGREVNPDLTALCMPSQKGRIKVTEKSDAHTCPYCRCDIKGTESILIEPYQSTRDTTCRKRDDDEDKKEEEEDDDDDEDHEDVELVMKKLAAMKRASQEDYQFTNSSLAPPPLPPKQNTFSSPCQSPKPHVRPAVSDRLVRDHANLASCSTQSEIHQIEETFDRFGVPQKIPEECINKITEAIQFTNPEQIPQQIMTFLKFYDQFNLDVAVTGDSGSGKSTLINALLGLDIDAKGAAPSGVIETTMEPAMYQYTKCNNVRLWDLPGMGTPSFKSKTYVKKMNFNIYDMFFVVVSERFRENNMLVIDEIQKQKKPFYVIRTKVDNDLLAQSRKRNFTETGALTVMRDECIKYVEEKNLHPQIFLVSAYDTQNYEMQKLKDTFKREAPVFRREVFPCFLASLFSGDWRKQRTCLHQALQSGKISKKDVPDLRTFCKCLDIAKGTESLMNTLEALDHFQLDVAILGETGSGVTTFLNSLMKQQKEALFSACSETPATSPHYPNVRFWAVSEIEKMMVSSEKINEFLDNFDFYLLIVSDSNKAQHSKDLAQVIQTLQRQYYFVQTKIDCHLHGPKDLGCPEVLDGLRVQCFKELQMTNSENSQLFLINSLDRRALDFVGLESVLGSDLATIKTSAFAYYINRMTTSINGTTRFTYIYHNKTHGMRLRDSSLAFTWCARSVLPAHSLCLCFMPLPPPHSPGYRVGSAP